jgi:hypothetical protein
MSRTKRHWMQRRPDRLTKAQEAALPAIIEKWTKVALSTAPSDHKQAEKSIIAFYAAHNWKYPEFIWIDSPTELEKLHHVKKAVNLPWRSRRWGGDSYQSWLNAVRYYKACVVNPLQQRIIESVPRVASSLQPWLSGPNRPQNQYGIPLDWVLDMEVKHYGPHLAQWCAFVDFFSRTAAATKIAHLRPLLDAVASCGSVSFYFDAIIFMERPRVMTLDASYRPHALDRPAIEYRNGAALYAIHGTEIPEKWIKTPAEQLDLAEILAEPNAEIRTALIAKYGFDRLLRNVRHRTISKRKGNSLVEFTIHRKETESESGETETRRRERPLRLRALHLTWRDKTGRKETVLPVPRMVTQFGRNDRPRNINDCEQVRRWTLGWPKEAIAVAET